MDSYTIDFIRAGTYEIYGYTIDIIHSSVYYIYGYTIALLSYLREDFYDTERLTRITRRGLTW